MDVLHVQEDIVAFMKKMARIHHPITLVDNDFQHFGQALIVNIKDAIKDRFTPAVERAW